MTLVAFVDESESRQDLDAGTYILCATVVSEEDAPALRDHMVRIKPASRKKLHWHDQRTVGERVALADRVGSLDAKYIVVVRIGGVDARSERRRRMCLERLSFELQSLGVSHVTFESRGRADDKRDVDLLQTLRARKIIHAPLRFDHVPGPAEPLLWISDVVCGAVTQDRIGHSEMLDPMRHSVTFHEVHAG